MSNSFRASNNNVDDCSTQADSRPKSAGLVWESAAACTVLHSWSTELDELSKWLCNNDSTTSIVIITVVVVAELFSDHLKLEWHNIFVGMLNKTTHYDRCQWWQHELRCRTGWQPRNALCRHPDQEYHERSWSSALRSRNTKVNAQVIDTRSE